MWTLQYEVYNNDGEHVFTTFDYRFAQQNKPRYGYIKYFSIN